MQGRYRDGAQALIHGGTLTADESRVLRLAAQDSGLNDTDRELVRDRLAEQ